MSSLSSKLKGASRDGLVSSDSLLKLKESTNAELFCKGLCVKLVNF